VIVNKAEQPILTIDPVEQKTFGDDPFPLIPQGGAEGINVLQWRSNAENIATVDHSTGEVTIKGAGEVTFTVTKPENTNYLSRDTTRTININKAEQPMLTIDNIPQKAFGDQPFDLSVQGGVTAIPTRWESDADDVATVDPNTGRVEIKSAGEVTFTATKAANNNYLSRDTTLTVTIDQAPQPILTINPVPQKTYGDPAFTLRAQGGADEISALWESSDEDIATVNSTTGNVIIKGAGEVTFTATKPADNNYRTRDTTLTININKAKQPTLTIDPVTPKTYGDPSFTLETQGGTDGINVLWRSSAEDIATVDQISGRAVIKGAGKVTFTATKEETKDYLSRDTSITITIAKAQQPVLTINPVTQRTYGDIPFKLTTTGGAEEIAAEWESNARSIAPVDPQTGLVTIKGTGEVTFTATKPADKNYFKRDTTITINIEKATLNVSTEDIEITYLDPIPQLNISYSNFATGDDAAVFTAPPTVTTEAKEGSPAGTYDIIVAGGRAKNYDITHTNAKLTINRREPVASDLYISPKTAVYTGKAHTVKVDTVNGVQGLAKISGIKYDGDAAAPVEPGIYPITVNIANGQNYSSVTALFVDELVIEKAPIDSAKLTVNDQVVPGKVLVVPAGNEKGLGTIVVKFNGSTEIPTTPGTYKVTVDHADGDYYQDATDFEVGTYTITESDEPTNPDDEDLITNNQITKTRQGRVWANGTQLFIQAEHNEQVRIYTLGGLLLTALDVTSGERKEVEMPQGFYVVVLDGKTYKIMIR
jgi:uncharacterized protein YjdB